MNGVGDDDEGDGDDDDTESVKETSRVNVPVSDSSIGVDPCAGETIFFVCFTYTAPKRFKAYGVLLTLFLWSS